MTEPALTQDELNRRRAELAGLGRLWSELNDPRRFGTPQSTIDAICYAVKARGLDALQEPDTLARLARCDQAAKQQIDKRIETMLKGKAS
jgi:hypothetical protein